MIITELLQNSEPSLKEGFLWDKLHAALDAKNTIENKLLEAENDNIESKLCVK